MSEDPPIPDSPVFAQINCVGGQVKTIVSPGMTNGMLMDGICHLMAQLVVRTNSGCGGVVPTSHLMAGLLTRINEVTPQLTHLVQIQEPPKEP